MTPNRFGERHTQPRPLDAVLKDGTVAQARRSLDPRQDVKFERTMSPLTEMAATAAPR